MSLRCRRSSSALHNMRLMYHLSCEDLACALHIGRDFKQGLQCSHSSRLSSEIPHSNALNKKYII